MSYNQNQKLANEISQKALAKIADNGLTPSPDIYELWYTYFGALDPELLHGVDTMEKSGHILNDDDCQDLHQQFISQHNHNQRVRDAGDKISETIQAVGSAAVNVKKATEEYNSSLSNATKELSASDIDIEKAREVLSDVVSNTQDMMERNQRLEDDLTKYTAAMQELRRDLELVKKEAITDSLTGLSNRKAFDSELIRIAAEAAENGTTFSLVMMDIDHFKQFNDSFGHQVGDQVLRLVARTLIDGVKGRDIVARYGGEEFAIIFPETSITAGQKVANNLRLAVAGKEVINRNSGEKLGRITLSGGISEYVLNEDIQGLIERADSALYAAKHNGRNRIASGGGPRAAA